MTERLHFHFSLSCIGEGNGNPLQYSCLENPRDGGAWWAAIYGVVQSRTRLKRLSSSSSSISWGHRQCQGEKVRKMKKCRKVVGTFLWATDCWLWGSTVFRGRRKGLIWKIVFLVSFVCSVQGMVYVASRFPGVVYCRLSFLPCALGFPVINEWTASLWLTLPPSCSSGLCTCLIASPTVLVTVASDTAEVRMWDASSLFAFLRISLTIWGPLCFYMMIRSFALFLWKTPLEIRQRLHSQWTLLEEEWTF